MANLSSHYPDSDEDNEPTNSQYDADDATTPIPPQRPTQLKARSINGPMLKRTGEKRKSDETKRTKQKPHVVQKKTTLRPSSNMGRLTRNTKVQFESDDSDTPEPVVNNRVKGKIQVTNSDDEDESPKKKAKHSHIEID